MSKLHLPLPRNPVANAQSSAFVDVDMALMPTINDELAHFMAFAAIPDAPIPEFLVFEDMEIHIRAAFEDTFPTLFYALMLTLQANIPVSCNLVPTPRSSSLVDDNLARTPTIDDKLDLLSDFALNPDAPVPDLHVFDELDAIFREFYEASDPELFDDLMCTLQGIKAMATIGSLNIVPLDDITIDLVKATPSDHETSLAVLAPVDTPPATDPGVHDKFIFYGDFAANASGGVHIPTIFAHPRGRARRSVMFWLVIEFKFLAMRIMAGSSAFLVTMQDITKDEFARYREKRKFFRIPPLTLPQATFLRPVPSPLPSNDFPILQSL